METIKIKYHDPDVLRIDKIKKGDWIDLRSAEDITLKAGERVMQGVFVPFLKADNGNSNNERTGGTGSTGAK